MSESHHIVCPACGAINRVPVDRPAAEAHCGTCKAKLFDGHPLAADTAAFDRHTTKGDIPVLVDVWAPWCGPCRGMAPEFERAAQALEPKFRLLKVNADEQPAVSARYGIRSIPTLLLLKDGRLKAQTAGAMGTADIVDWAKSHV